MINYRHQTFYYLCQKTKFIILTYNNLWFFQPEFHIDLFVSYLTSGIHKYTSKREFCIIVNFSVYELFQSIWPFGRHLKVYDWRKVWRCRCRQHVLCLVLVRYHGNVTEQLQSPYRTCGEYCRDFTNWISLRAWNISLKALQSRHQSSFLIVSRLSFTKDRHADEYCNTVYYTVLQYNSIGLILYRKTLSYSQEAQPIVGCEPICLNQSGP